MIEKERLEELIEQGATIWSDNHCPINLINDSKHKIKLLSNALYVAEEFENCAHTHTWWDNYTIGFDDLYENEEDSKWAEEFGHIKRIERLELPTWEEISSGLKDVPAGTYVIKEFDDVSLEYIKYNEVFIGIYKGHYEWKEWEATKENYTLACRKAKELFLGEKK